MSGKHYFLDTNAVVFLLMGGTTLSHLLAKAQWIGIPVITQIEFLAFPKITAQDIRIFERFLSRVEVVDLCHEDKNLIRNTIELRSKHAIKLPDAAIVASAMLNQAILITADKKLLGLSKHIAGLQVMEPLQ